MDKLNKEIKKQMIEQRLEQYRHQLFSLEMNRVALEACGESTEETLKQIEGVKKSFKAVEGMLNA